LPESETALKIALLFFIPGALCIAVQRSFTPLIYRSDFDASVAALIHGSLNYLICWPVTQPLNPAAGYPRFYQLLVFFLIAPVLQGLIVGIVRKRDLWAKFLRSMFQTKIGKRILSADAVILSDNGEMWDRMLDTDTKRWVHVHLKTGSVYQGLICGATSSATEKQLVIESPKRMSPVQFSAPEPSKVFIRGDDVSHIEFFD
jgi:hypothetical protein